MLFPGRHTLRALLVEELALFIKTLAFLEKSLTEWSGVVPKSTRGVILHAALIQALTFGQ